MVCFNFLFGLVWLGVPFFVLFSFCCCRVPPPSSSPQMNCYFGVRNQVKEKLWSLEIVVSRNPFQPWAEAGVGKDKVRKPVWEENRQH